VVAGVAVGLWIADRRYRRIGGRDGTVLEIATLAVPAGLVGARLYSVLTNYSLYLGHGRSWVGILRIWDGGLGLPGAMAGAALAAWIYSRRAGIALGPVAGAAAPALAFAQAIGCWGGWFSQNLYGWPAALPWAVEISPARRASGYESYATFQPVFLYESLWAIGLGVLLIYASRRLLLTGGRIFAVYAALYAIGRLGAEALRIVGPAYLFGFRVNQVMMIGVLVAALAYLQVSRARRGPELAVGANGAPGRRAAAVTAAQAPGQDGSASHAIEGLAPTEAGDTAATSQ